ncbi:WD40/YVTN/BNR-like repeat-containing protein [Mucisphaera sp.]|uniref:WD40/YVTN/BNR-like repeat-containing protein n=1 Tax=Mucisphaera sp. TaxID=2913024 RepID=UPI003D0C2D44
MRALITITILSLILTACTTPPTPRIAHTFAPLGESNVRSSITLAPGTALIGTEETADIYKTTDNGQTWRKTTDAGDLYDAADIRNFIRAHDGSLYATTSEPALILKSTDEGESWSVVARPKASRTVALTQLDNGVIIAGLRRSENNRISIIRTEDHFQTFEHIPVSNTLPRQNTTCLIDLGQAVVLTGVGFEASGKIFKSTDAGKTWRQTADFPDARDLMHFFKTDEAIYVTASGIATLYRSEDQGETWHKHHQAFDKGFLGDTTTITLNNQPAIVMTATDQSQKPFRHLLLISTDNAHTWQEWIQLATDNTGGASNIETLSPNTLITGTGNHATQGYAYTIRW